MKLKTTAEHELRTQTDKNAKIANTVNQTKNNHLTGISTKENREK